LLLDGCMMEWKREGRKEERGQREEERERERERGERERERKGSRC
jgi:hypothetical protein